MVEVLVEFKVGEVYLCEFDEELLSLDIVTSIPDGYIEFDTFLFDDSEWCKTSISAKNNGHDFVLAPNLIRILYGR